MATGTGGLVEVVMSDSGDGGSGQASGSSGSTGWLAGLEAANASRDDPAAQQAIVDAANSGWGDLGLSFGEFMALGAAASGTPRGAALRAAREAAIRAQRGAATLTLAIEKLKSAYARGDLEATDAFIRIIDAVRGTEPAARAVFRASIASFAENFGGAAQWRSLNMSPLSNEAEALLDPVERFASSALDVLLRALGDGDASEVVDDAPNVAPDLRLTAPVHRPVSRRWNPEQIVVLKRDAEGQPVLDENGKQAVDYVIPVHYGDDYEGTPDDDILTAAPGLVVRVVEESEHDDDFARYYANLAGDEGKGLNKNRVGNGLGNHVVVYTFDGKWVIYGHLSSFSTAAQPNRLVSRGEVLGKMGNTGYVESHNSDERLAGVHLHFEVRVWVWDDPKRTKGHFQIIDPSVP